MITRKVELIVPKVPNFIMVTCSGVTLGDGDSKIAVQSLSEEEINELGAAWTEKLRKKKKELISYRGAKALCDDVLGSKNSKRRT